MCLQRRLLRWSPCRCSSLLCWDQRGWGWGGGVEARTHRRHLPLWCVCYPHPFLALWLPNYQWWVLPQVWFLSRQACLFVTTKVCLLQTNIFVVTKLCLPQQNICCNKCVFVATSLLLLRQKMGLSWQTYLWQLPPMVPPQPPISPTSPSCFVSSQRVHFAWYLPLPPPPPRPLPLPHPIAKKMSSCSNAFVDMTNVHHDYLNVKLHEGPPSPTPSALCPLTPTPPAPTLAFPSFFLELKTAGSGLDGPQGEIVNVKSFWVKQVKGCMLTGVSWTLCRSVNFLLRKNCTF